MTPRVVLADRLWDGGWVEGGGVLLGDGLTTPATPDDLATHPVTRVAGSLIPGVTDAHVHLDLVDPPSGGLARVLDLGGRPDAARPDGLEVARAGRILTAVGGYPSMRTWAAGGMFREVGAHDVDAAVAEQVGAVAIKIALNFDAGPVWPDDVLAAVVAAAHAHQLPVVAHVEGAGQAARAAAAGVDALAHTPFTEHLDEALLQHFAATTIWISTLRIHGAPDVALSNASRFHAAGGRILYGTDMGNGPSSGGLERDELELLAAAGLGFDELVAAVSGEGLLPRWGARASLIPDGVTGLDALLAAVVVV